MLTALLAAAWLIGVALAAWQTPGGVWTALVLAAVLGAAPFGWRRAGPAVCAATVCGGLALLGTARWQAVNRPLPPDNIAHQADQGRLTVLGVARADAEDRGQTRRIEVQVESIVVDDEYRAASGGMLVRVRAATPVRAGDRLRLFGTVNLPPTIEGFDYPEYLARRGIHATMEYPALRVVEHGVAPPHFALLAAARRAANQALDRHLPFPESALARGISTGDRSAMPRDLTEEFNRSGTSHLIAISGFNITLVAVMVTGGLAWLLGRRRAALLALATITAYALFVGLSASVARALIMGILAVGVAILGRPGTPAIALALAAAAMTAHDPRIIDDVGFQLSFSATAGLMVLSPPLTAAGERWLVRLLGDGGTGRAAVALWSVAAVTVAASVATLPVMLHAFGRVSAIAVLPNLLLVPLFPVVMLAAGAAALAGSISPALGGPVGGLAWGPLALTIAVVRSTATLPGAGLSVPPIPGWAVVLTYALCGAAAGHFARSRPLPSTPHVQAVEPLRLRPVVMLALAVPALGLGLSWDSLRGGGGRTALHVTFVDSGGAVLAVVTGPGGERVIVNTGAAPSAVRAAIDPLLPGRTKRATLLLLTRDSPSTSGGLAAAMERYQPATVLSADPQTAATHHGLGVPVTLVRPGSVLRLTGGATLEFAAGAEPNSVTAVAVLGARRIAITPETSADIVVRPPAHSATGGAIIETNAGYPWFDLHNQGPLRVETDGERLRLIPARGALPPAPAARPAAHTP